MAVTCRNSTPYYVHVRLSGGDAGATEPTQRKMSLGANQITYSLYRDPLGWGSTDGVNTTDGIGTASAVNPPIHGRIPPQPARAPGTYSNTIVVTVSFL